MHRCTLDSKHSCRLFHSYFGDLLTQIELHICKQAKCWPVRLLVANRHINSEINF